MSSFFSSSAYASLPCCSSSSVRSWKYDVFISFRGEDTRNSFTSFLLAALRWQKIETYIDEEGLERGDQISAALMRAIEESMISVVVFSENYANSSWCLDELVHILRCKREYGRQVVPVFYMVDPSDVRNQRGGYAIGFKQLQKHSKEKVNSWRAALTEAANLAGWGLQVTGGNEYKMVEKIVEDVLNKLNGMSPSCDHEYLKGLFGIEKHIKKIESLLNIGTQEDVRILGIWGMGGIGKTTLARVLFSKFSHLFEGRCFLSNVREISKIRDGFRVLKVELFAELLNREVRDPDNTFERRQVRSKEVLIVLDDVSHEAQLTDLAGDRGGSFGPGSRIIVTTRDKRVLIQANDIYELDGLNRDDALALFHWHAFKETSPTPDFNEVSKQVVDYAEGNPLALKISGDFFRGREIEDWKSLLERLKGSSIEDEPSIHKILKISYDELRKDEKDAFLDIACFFNGKSKSFVERLVGVTIIKDLVDKSLVTYERGGFIRMHDLVQEMGRKVVRESSDEDLGKLSRIWNGDDAYSVLHNNIGTEKIEAIYLARDKEGRWETQLDLPRDVFKKMYNLRLLKFSDKTVCLPEGLDCLPNKLNYLEWHYYPLKSLPKNFNPCHLVQLDMSSSDELEQLWDGVKDLHNLRTIHFSGCKNLTQLPDFSRASKLTAVILSKCKSLKKFPQLPKSLPSLYVLRIRECKRIESFPTKIYWKSLAALSIRGCYKLKIFPEIEKPMENLTELNLSRTAIKELPKSIENLVYLKYLFLEDCKKLQLLPDTMCKLYHLEVLSIVSCSKLKIIRRLPPRVEDFNAAGCISLEEELVEHWFDHNYYYYFWGRKIKMIWAAHKIPRWFSYQNKKSSLTMKLCLNSFEINSLSIAFCAVIDINWPINLYNYHLSCQAHCDGAPDGVLFTWGFHYWREVLELHGDHVLIGCDDKRSRKGFMNKLKEYKATRNGGCTSISVNFNFSVAGHLKKSFNSQKLNLKVKNCGVYLLNAKDAENFGIKNW